MKKILNLIMALTFFAAAPIAMAEGALDKENFAEHWVIHSLPLCSRPLVSV